MRLKVTSSATIIGLNNFGTIESDTLEWIDSDEDHPGVCIDAMLGVTIADCVKDCRN